MGPKGTSSGGPVSMRLHPALLATTPRDAVHGSRAATRRRS
ncbi:hypothetical protein ACIPPS_10350 [Streptomyces sp. NPDC090127]